MSKPQDIGPYQPDLEKDRQQYQQWEDQGLFHACTLDLGQCTPDCPNKKKQASEENPP